LIKPGGKEKKVLRSGPSEKKEKGGGRKKPATRKHKVGSQGRRKRKRSVTSARPRCIGKKKKEGVATALGRSTAKKKRGRTGHRLMALPLRQKTKHVLGPGFSGQDEKRGGSDQKKKKKRWRKKQGQRAELKEPRRGGKCATTTTGLGEKVMKEYLILKLQHATSKRGGESQKLGK